METVLSLTTSGQTPRHDSQGLSMALTSHVKCSENSDTFINMTNSCKDMQTDENGGEYLNIKIWKLLDINKKTDARGRIHAGETYIDKEIRVFVSDVEHYPETCKNYILLPKSIYTEVRKTRLKDQRGEPLKVQNNGDVWTTQKDKFVKIFVRK
jgi:hypothetical protein